VGIGTARPKTKRPRRVRRRGQGTLRINVIPWARVSVDGRYRGNTPLTLSLSVGRHRIKLVNPAFCRMFRVRSQDVIGEPAETILDDISDFRRVWNTGEVYRGKPREFPEYDLLVNQVIFSIADEGIVACIMADYSHQLDQRRELMAIKDETIKNVNEVVDNQMKVVQEIAGLLGETTAQTKVSLLKIIQMLQHEAVESVSGLAVEAEEGGDD